ncbi:alkaline phosphatase family protein [Halegenticoccus tardaugens]|uniref:alkaline phosphatase family protein n=1 Tax=Halegenticoccus tardaugens TaxID=2071624 RepID=UPI00100B7C63|nr:alkaline phosphatase family protein [Halegenticoccus tardaugens]
MELLVAGLDGLSYNMLDRFDVDAPFLRRTRGEGVSGDLMSVDTPTTIPAWTSFATGKDPGSHGISNMLRQDASYEVGPSRPNATDAAVYDFLDDSVFVNLPASVGRVPAAENAHLVSAMLARDEADAVPDELKALDAYDDYVLDHDASLKVRPSAYLDHVLGISTARHRFAREAFETFKPRVGFVLFSTPDWAGHILSNLSSDAARRDFYARLVELVDELAADLAGLADNVVLLSDHGFEHKHTNVHLAEWLGDEGYFAEEETTTGATDVAVAAARAAAKRSDRLYALIRRVHNHIMGTAVGASLESAASPQIDFPNSRAWQLRYGCVYVNDDRFDHPTVDDADALRREIREGLRELTDDEGRRIFRDVLLPGEAYENPGPDAPDVIARPAPGFFPTTLWSPTGGVTSPTDNYEHRYRGIFAANGPLFAGGEAIEGLSIVDALPTILAALGEPLSPEFDGEARLDALAEPAEPSVLSADEVPRPRTRPGDLDGTDRDGAVEDRLADLGYIE